MSKHSPAPASKRFFLSYHRYITTTSPPHHPPHPYPPLQAPPTQHHPPLRHLRPFPLRHASTSSSTSSPPQTSPKPPLTHYSLFPSTLPLGPPPHGPFAINPRLLRHEYLSLQSQSHPDLHHGPDKSHFATTSALINEAYKTLLHPLPRATYLLSLRGITVSEDSGLESEEGDAELLSEVLEVREAIEGAREEGELEGMKGENEGRIRESEGVIGEAFGRDDVEGAKRESVRLRYWVNIKEVLDGWEEGKGVVLVH